MDIFCVTLKYSYELLSIYFLKFLQNFSCFSKISINFLADSRNLWPNLKMYWMKNQNKLKFISLKSFSDQVIATVILIPKWCKFFITIWSKIHDSHGAFRKFWVRPKNSHFLRFGGHPPNVIFPRPWDQKIATLAENRQTWSHCLQTLDALGS